MDDKTRMYNEDYEEFSAKENEQEMQPDEDTIEENSPEAKSTLPGYINLGVGVAAGLGVGIFGAHVAYANIFQKDEDGLEPSPIPESSFLADILVKADTPVASGIKSGMTQEEAYLHAREQVGPGGVFVWNGSVYGTYKEEEWAELTDEQQNDYFSSFNLITQETQPLNLFDDIQLSTMVNDDMSFGEAFAAARTDLGAGGVFLWKGNAFNTYYKEEWNDLSLDDKENFITGYLELPEIASLPIAEVGHAQQNINDDFEWANQDDNNYPVAEEAQDDYPIAEAWQPEENSDAEFSTDNEPVYEATPVVDELPSSYVDDTFAQSDFLTEEKSAQTINTDSHEQLIDPELSLNDFIHQTLYNGQIAGQQDVDEMGGMLPDDLVAGIELPDDGSSL